VSRGRTEELSYPPAVHSSRLHLTASADWSLRGGRRDAHACIHDERSPGAHDHGIAIDFNYLWVIHGQRAHAQQHVFECVDVAFGRTAITIGGWDSCVATAPCAASPRVSGASRTETSWSSSSSTPPAPQATVGPNWESLTTPHKYLHSSRGHSLHEIASGILASRGAS
jgi:hypothetical protein